MSSGSLITAAYAAEQGKTVMAFPGNITSMSSLGTNKLIQDGAIPVAGLNDIILTLGMPANVDTKIIDDELGADEKKIFEIVRHRGEVTANQIAEELGRSVSDVNTLVSIMEIKGFLLTSIGKIYINV